MSKKVEPVFAGYRDDKFVAAMPDWGNLSHRHDAEGGLTIVDAVIVPLAEWERVKRYDARTMPLGDLYDVYDERLQDSISEDE